MKCSRDPLSRTAERGHAVPGRPALRVYASAQHVSR